MGSAQLYIILRVSTSQIVWEWTVLYACAMFFFIFFYKKLKLLISYQLKIFDKINFKLIPIYILTVHLKKF